MSDQPSTPSQVPYVYANAVGLAYSITDCSLTFVCNGESVVNVILPFPTGKSLGEDLQKMIATFEKRSKTVVPRLEQVLNDPSEA